nr:sensor domain-containing diguanylate cyclase [Falsirhodobacter halotolerans]
MNVAKHNDEYGRIAALSRYDVENIQARKEYADIVQILKTIFSIPIAAITTIDSHRLWIRASAGIPCTDHPREDTFCRITVTGDGPLAVSDAQKDIRFSDNPLVTGDAKIRSYLGVPLTTPDGYNVGTLCLFDTSPREFTEGEKAILSSFAKVIVSQLELKQSASIDRLTGAQTRHVFEEGVARHDCEKQSAVLVLFDIDHFKQINDTFGHHIGDEALTHVANVTRASLMPTDSFGRLGGEEFAVLMKGVTSSEAFERAEGIRSAIAASQLETLGQRKITISVGVANLTFGEPVKELIQRADTALYHAKRSGRNQTVAWPINNNPH